mmetsp:Transcript_70432/g.199727  ORF Transcript_70432/g.199727 Transcript_70432/m.199727 type:complete len:452 (-) Transcript_70432:155-1510(-)
MRGSTEPQAGTKQITFGTSPPDTPRSGRSRAPSDTPEFVRVNYKGHIEAAGVGGLDSSDDEAPGFTSRLLPPSKGGLSGVLVRTPEDSTVVTKLPSADTRLQDGREPQIEYQAPLPLIIATQPKHMDFRGRYTVKIRRASLRQPFGVTFDAAETRDRQLARITVAEELPHLGMAKGDNLIVVNNKQPSSITECRSILQKAMSIHLTLERNPDQVNAPPPKRLPHGPLLSVTPAVITNARRGEFKVSMHRSSVRQRFGLGFHAVQPRRRGEEPPILISESLPHLALRRADRLVSLNGVRPGSKAICAQILGSAVTIDLVLRRDPRHLGFLAHEVELLEDEPNHDIPFSGMKGSGGCLALLAAWGCVHQHGVVTEVVNEHQVKVPAPTTLACYKGGKGKDEIIGFDAMGGPVLHGQDLFGQCMPDDQAPSVEVIGHDAMGGTMGGDWRPGPRR